MAFIETRKNKDGARRYRVWWRLGGTRYREPQSETFFDKGSALTFKLAVEASGHDWPDDYVKGRRLGHRRTRTAGAGRSAGAVRRLRARLRAGPVGGR